MRLTFAVEPDTRVRRLAGQAASVLAELGGVAVAGAIVSFATGMDVPHGVRRRGARLLSGRDGAHRTRACRPSHLRSILKVHPAGTTAPLDASAAAEPAPLYLISRQPATAPRPAARGGRRGRRIPAAAHARRADAAAARSLARRRRLRPFGGASPSPAIGYRCVHDRRIGRRVGAAATARAADARDRQLPRHRQVHPADAGRGAAPAGVRHLRRHAAAQRLGRRRSPDLRRLQAALRPRRAHRARARAGPARHGRRTSNGAAARRASRSWTCRGTA